MITLKELEFEALVTCFTVAQAWFDGNVCAQTVLKPGDPATCREMLNLALATLTLGVFMLFAMLMSITCCSVTYVAIPLLLPVFAIILALSFLMLVTILKP